MHALQLQPQLRTSRRFYFHQATCRRAGARSEQFHECWQGIRALLGLGLSPSWLWPGGIETPSPFPQARLIHIQCPRRGIDPIALDQLYRCSPALPAAAIALHAYFATPPIAAEPALHRPDRAPFPVPCCRASRPWHTLSANGNWSHACSPETHKAVRLHGCC